MHTLHKNSHTDKNTITQLFNIIVQVLRTLDNTSAAREPVPVLLAAETSEYRSRILDSAIP